MDRPKDCRQGHINQISTPMRQLASDKGRQCWDLVLIKMKCSFWNIGMQTIRGKRLKFLRVEKVSDKGSETGGETGLESRPLLLSGLKPTLTPTETLQTSQSMRGCKRKSESELTPLSPSQRLRTVGTTHIVADLLHDLIVHDVFADLL